MVYEISPDDVVYETDEYVIDVGLYPGEELECYRVWNKRWGVLEYAHSISFYAIEWTKEATKIVKGEEGAELPGLD